MLPCKHWSTLFSKGYLQLRALISQNQYMVSTPHPNHVPTTQRPTQLAKEAEPQEDNHDPPDECDFNLSRKGNVPVSNSFNVGDDACSSDYQPEESCRAANVMN